MAESFRVKKSFTVVQNTVARDKSLSEKALGLYVRIQCWITLPDRAVSKSFLLSRCSSGEKAFESSWKELQRRGYLKTYQYRAPNSVTFDTEHELLETAEPETPYFYIVTRPAGRISSVWFYGESGADTQNGLSVLLDGDAVQQEDRLRAAAAVSSMRSRPPQNRGGWERTPREGSSCERPPCDRGDTINNNEVTPVSNPSVEEPIQISGDGDEPSPALFGATEALWEEGRKIAERLYRRFASGRYTDADVDSVLRSVCLGSGGEMRTDRERVRLLAYAFDQARQAGLPGNWKYIGGVLARLYERGIGTLEAAEQYDQMRLEGFQGDEA